MKYPEASNEPLGLIEANECNGNQSLTTKRFEAVFNEIERLHNIITKLTVPNPIVEGLQAAVAYAKGDETQGKTQRFIVENGVAVGVEEQDA